MSWFYATQIIYFNDIMLLFIRKIAKHLKNLWCVQLGKNFRIFFKKFITKL